MMASDAQIRSTDVARAGLWTGVMVAVAPFELRDLTFGVGGLQVSIVEVLALLAALSNLWALRGAYINCLSRIKQPVFVTLLGWMILNLLSALWSEQPTETLKFGLRNAGGVLLALSCALLGRHEVFRRRLALGLLVGLAGLTGIGACERLIGRPFERFLRLFRDEPTWMLGEPRLSTVFYHANTLAAYLELVLPLMIITVAHQKGRAALRWGGWVLVVGYMLSLTYSRAGLGAGVFGALVLAAASGQARRKQRLWALVFALLLCVAYFGNPDMRARLGGAKRSYKVSYEFMGACAGQPGQTVDLTVRVTNLGQWPISDRHAPGELGWVIWPTEGRPPAAHFSYHPLRALSTGQHQDVPIEVRLPKQLGPHPLVVDIRRKEVVWLSAAGAELDGILCQVSSDEQIVEAKYRPMDEIQMQSRPLELSRLHYWRAALELFVLKPWLGHGADQFRWRYRDHVPDKAWDLRARAHSVVMENAADLGAVGLFILGVLATLIGLRMLANLRAVEKIAPEQLAATVGFCSFAAHSMVDYFFAYTQILLIMWPVLGLALSTELVHRPAYAPATEPELPTQPEDGSLSP